MRLLSVSALQSCRVAESQPPALTLMRPDQPVSCWLTTYPCKYPEQAVALQPRALAASKPGPERHVRVNVGWVTPTLSKEEGEGVGVFGEMHLIRPADCLVLISRPALGRRLLLPAKDKTQITHPKRPAPYHCSRRAETTRGECRDLHPRAGRQRRDPRAWHRSIQSMDLTCSQAASCWLAGVPEMPSMVHVGVLFLGGTALPHARRT